MERSAAWSKRQHKADKVVNHSYDHMKQQTIVISGVVVLILGAAWYGIAQLYPSQDAQAPEQRTVVVTLDQQNNSGETGTATLTAVGGKTQVELRLAGAPAGIVQPAHIHTGTCANISGVVYPLVFPVDGVSVTTLDISLDTIFTELPLAINVHKSAQEAGIYYACGDITK